MSAIQLRRYQLKPGSVDAFLDAWKGACDVRAQFGFAVEFAVVDRANEGFVWAVSVDGDFDEADQAYYASPARAALPVDPASFVVEKWLTMVEDVAP